MIQVVSVRTTGHQHRVPEMSSTFSWNPDVHVNDTSGDQESGHGGNDPKAISGAQCTSCAQGTCGAASTYEFILGEGSLPKPPAAGTFGAVHALAPSPAFSDLAYLTILLQTKRKFPLSDEQRAICRRIYDDYHPAKDQAGDGDGVVPLEQSMRNLMIDSVAGSGKTSTLLMCLWFMPPETRVLLLSFNKSVQQTLQTEVNKTAFQIRTTLGRSMPQCDVHTCHAHGLAALRSAGMGAHDHLNEMSDNKYHAIHEALRSIAASSNGMASESQLERLLKRWKWHMQGLLKLMMNLAVDCGVENVPWSEEAVEQAAVQYDIPMPKRKTHEETMMDLYVTKDARKRRRTGTSGLAARSGGGGGVDHLDCYEYYMQVLYEAYRICCQRRSGFDYTDMVYLPVRLDLALPQYDVVLIDEAQDLNAIQIEMVARSMAPAAGAGGGVGRSRVVFVGDVHQAIYGFRGADTRAIDTIMRRFDTLTMPLHTCWRCSESVIRVAQSMVPHIQARPGAPEGDTHFMSETRAVRVLRDRDTTCGHLMLCRTNAPLIEMAIKLSQAGVDSHVEAGTLRNTLVRLLKQVQDAHWIKVSSLVDRIKRFRTWKKNNLGEGS